jgi:hypothetical protein
MIFKIDLTDADIELIGLLLDEQPYKKVFDIARRMQAQINQQLSPQPELKPAARKRKGS